MDKPPHTIASEAFKRSAQEQREIVRAIALSVSSMDETTIETRELIAQCREFTRRLDRVLKWR
jgi:hypothetical protein